MVEIWKPIKNYEGCYEISNLGRVKSLARKLKRGKIEKDIILVPIKKHSRIFASRFVFRWKNETS